MIATFEIEVIRTSCVLNVKQLILPFQMQNAANIISFLLIVHHLRLWLIFRQVL